MKLMFILLLFFTMCTRVNNSLRAVSAQDNSMLNKPNIILIMADDIGYETLMCNEGGSYETPNLDSFANANTRYTECHSCPICSPSRSEIMTGKYNFRNYLRWGHMDISNKTFGNMFKDAGYKTALYGKWQLDDADVSINAFGFDDYVVWYPFSIRGDTSEFGSGSRYKNPKLYANGVYIPDNIVHNKYGEDVLTDSVIDFISRNKQNKFFCYYTMLLGHAPWQPTPDDPEYLSFDETNNNSDQSFYPSMIKYMDKKFGQIVHAVDSLGLSNTIIIFTGDNGTAPQIYSLYNGKLLQGGKGKTIESGTHVPLLITSGLHLVDSQLIDFSDFIPSLSEIAGITLPTDYGVLDGKSFFSQERDWIFCHYCKNPGGNDSNKIFRWVQNSIYKKYDSGTDHKDSLIKYQANPKNERGILILNKNMKRIDSNFNTVLKSMHE